MQEKELNGIYVTDMQRKCEYFVFQTKQVLSEMTVFWVTGYVAVYFSF